MMMAMDEAKSILAGKVVGKNIGPGTGWEENPQLVFPDVSGKNETQAEYTHRHVATSRTFISVNSRSLGHGSKEC